MVFCLSVSKPLSLLAVVDVILMWMALFVLAMVGATQEGEADIELLAYVGAGFAWTLIFGIYCSIATKADTRYTSRVERMATQRGHTMMFVSFMGFGPAAEYARLSTKAGSLANIAKALLRHSVGLALVQLGIRIAALAWFAAAAGPIQLLVVQGSVYVSLLVVAGSLVAGCL